MDNHYFRALLLHYWKQQLKASDTTQKICQIEGQGSLSVHTTRKWFKRFKEGDTSLKDKQRSGRPSTTDNEVLRELIEANPSTSTRRLSGETGVSQSTIVRHLHELGKVNRRCREVPHELNEKQAERRVEVCRQLLQNPRDERFIRRIVTCDEKWIYFSNPNKENQWLDPGQMAKPVAKRDRFSKKVMLCVWWNYEGIIYFELTPNNIAINSELYSEQLKRMHEVLSKRYPGLVNRKRVILKQDNARPHTARNTQETIMKLDSIELLPHPAYSPDLAPSDFHLFRSMAHFLRGRNFNNIEEVEIGCREFFHSKDKEWYRSGIEQLADRWIRTIEHDGLYFDF